MNGNLKRKRRKHSNLWPSRCAAGKNEWAWADFFSSSILILTCQHIINPPYKSNPEGELGGVDNSARGSPGGTPPYEVVDFGAGVVVEGHGRPEVFVVEKSGCKLNVLVAFGAQQAKVQAACDLGLQSLHMPSKKKEESQFAETWLPWSHPR